MKFSEMSPRQLGDLARECHTPPPSPSLAHQSIMQGAEADAWRARCLLAEGRLASITAELGAALPELRRYHEWECLHDHPTVHVRRCDCGTDEHNTRLRTMETSIEAILAPRG